MAKFFITQGGRFIEVEAPDEAAARAMADKPTDAATAANPNLTECPDCHHIVSTNAETCPSCGCKLKRPASTKPSASDIFKILFWIHQLILGLPSATIGLDFVIRGQTDGILAAIGLLLAWIGGTLVWGLAALMHRR